jgi:hypothetical protein
LLVWLFSYSNSKLVGFILFGVCILRECARDGKDFCSGLEMYQKKKKKKVCHISSIQMPNSLKMSFIQK